MFKKINFSYLFLLISFSFLFYIFYTSELLKEGLIRAYYVKYYFFSLFLICLSLLSFFVENKTKKIFSITLSLVLILLFIIEFVLLFDFKNNELKSSNKIKIFRQLKDKNNETSVSFYPSYFFDIYIKGYDNSKFLPLSNISNSQTLYCNESSNWITYQSDRYGFNNDDKIWDKNQIDYFIVGDSFAQGACVDQSKNFSGTLSNIENISAINVGMNGNGPLIEYASLKEYLKVKKVDKVIWLFYPNDIDDLQIEIANPVLIKYLNDSKFTQKLIQRQNEINNLISKRVNFEMFSSKFNFLKLTYTRKFLIDLMYKKNLKSNLKPCKITNEFKTFEACKKNISEAKIIENNNREHLFKTFENIIYSANKFTQNYGAEFYFVYLGSNTRYFSKNYSDKEYYKVLNIVKKLNIPIIDTHQILKDYPDPTSLWTSRWGHYTEYGYKFIINRVYSLINGNF